MKPLELAVIIITLIVVSGAIALTVINAPIETFALVAVVIIILFYAWKRQRQKRK